MRGKVCVVTGATSGIGRVVAEGLVAQGARVVLVGRSPDKVEQAVGTIRAATRDSAPDASVEGLVADFASLHDVRRLAREILARHERIDALVNNAGAIHTERQVSADGHELTLAVNHLAPFLLTYLLLGAVKAGAPSRIINVASEAHRLGALNFDDLHAEQSYSGMKVYGASKLCNIMFTLALARRLEGSGVVTHCLHPGTLATGFGQNTSGFYRFLVRIGGPFLPGPGRGARAVMRLLTDEAEGERSGLYFDKLKERAPAAPALDEAAQERLWTASARLVGVEWP